MTLIRSAATVLLALLVAAPAPAEDCTLGLVAELALQPVESAIPVVAVTINGSARRFIVEPGALWSAVSAPVATALGLKALPLRLLGRTEIYADGDELSQFTIADRLQFGGMEAVRAKLLLLPEKVIGRDIDGVLGSDFLGKFDLEFDFAQHVMRLVSQKHCKGRVVDWTHDYAAVPFKISPSRHLVVPMMLDGKRVSVAIDTARTSTALSESSAERLFGLSATSPGVDVPADPAVSRSLRFRSQFESLAIEGIAIRNPIVYVWADDNARAFSKRHTDKSQIEPATSIQLEQQDLAVGMDVLSHLHLYIAFAEKMLYLSAADAH